MVGVFSLELKCENTGNDLLCTWDEHETNVEELLEI